jgi:hypothetical protein
VTRHRFDPFSFLVGAVAIAVAALVLIGDVSVRLVDLRVIGPVVVLAIGAALLLGGRRDDRPVVVPAADTSQDADAALHDDALHDDAPSDETPEPHEPAATDTVRIDRDEE